MTTHNKYAGELKKAIQTKKKLKKALGDDDGEQV